jgi:hypothetical protein
MAWRLAVALGLCGLASCGTEASDPPRAAGVAADEGGEPGSGGEADEPAVVEDTPEIPEVDETELPEPSAQAGFIELESVSYVAPFESPPERRSEQTQLCDILR